jgi:CheY-like chemotaxis protein
VTSIVGLSDRMSFGSTIVLVEDEPVLRSSLARGLNKLTNVEVLAAANVAEAITLFDSRTPSLVISDIDLPGATGLELIGELKRRKVIIPIIFVTAYLKTYQAQIPEHPNVMVLEKPIPLEELRLRVLRLLGPAGEAARGPFSVVDYVQLACLGRHSVQIDVELTDGGAQVIIHEGDLWSAYDTEGTGADAFKRLVLLKEGTVTCSSLIGPPGPRSISIRWEQLVLESARTFDEAERDRKASSDPSPTVSRRAALAGTPRPALPAAEVDRKPPTQGARAASSASSTASTAVAKSLPPRDNVPRLPPPSVSVAKRPLPARTDSIVAPPAKSARAERPATFDELWSQGVEALLRREFGTAARAFSAAGKLRPDDPRIQANLLRLREMGHLENSGDDE